MRVIDGPLVTVMGGCGFIGSRVCRFLIGAGFRVRVFKKSQTGVERIGDLVDKVEIVCGDQASCHDVIAAIQDAQFVIHLIHSSVPGSSMISPASDIQANVASASAWLSRLPETQVRRVIYLSSGGTVYGRANFLPISENHPLEPISVYGVTKLACEKLVAMYSDLAGVEYRILRPSNAYGADQSTDRNQGILGVLMERLSDHKAVEIWGNGNGLRDYIHVDDLAQSVLTMLSHSGPSKIFNVSTSVGTSVLDLLAVLSSHFHRLPAVVHRPDRGFDVSDNVLANDKIIGETGWRPRIELEAGIIQLLNECSNGRGLCSANR